VKRAALAAALVLAGCGPGPPEQQGAERAVAEAAHTEARCTSRPYRWFVDGPPANIFICVVRAEHGFCDRYRVDRRGSRYRARLIEQDGSCTLPVG
jgi:hypothetical protein